MKVHGACHCRAVRYEAEVDPDHVTICHCTDCQRLTGTAYRVTIRALRKDFVLLAGMPKTYVKIAQSGAQRAQVFCADCGSPLYTHAIESSDTLGLRLGCIDERRQFEPRQQVWCDSALGWCLDIADLPRHAQE